MAAWPLTARARQERVRGIGVLQSLAADDPEGQARLMGWINGRNVRIDYRWTGDNANSRVRDL